MEPPPLPNDGLGLDDPTMVVDDILSGDESSQHDSDNDVSVEKGRKSVFDRLETDTRLKFNQKEMNFAKAVGKSTTTTALSFFPLANKEQSCIRIPKELATEVMKTHSATVFGYFLGPRLHFSVVERYVKVAWGKFGFSDLMMNNNGIYFFKFNDIGGSNQVVESGPLMIRGVPLFVEHWDPVKGLTKPVHTSCPLWVKLHNVPLVAFNKEGISRIASALGVPKQMDACTASMCDKAWGRPGFAKVLIDTWAVGELKRELQVLIPDLTGSQEARVTIRVEYLWEPSQCSHCLVFGHKASTCAKALIAQKSKGKTKTVDDQGFTLVQRKEWRPKAAEGSTSGTKGDNGQQKEVSQPAIVSPMVEKNSVTQPVPEGESSPIQPVEDTVQSMEDVSVVVTEQPQKLKETTALVEPAPSGGIQGDNTVRHFTAPLDVPLRTILKNTNRFSPLEEDGRAQVKGKEQIKSSGTSVLNAPKKPMGTPRHSRLELGGGVCKSTFGRWSWVSNQSVCAYGTRIILSWDPSIFDVMVIDMHAQCIHSQVKVRGTDVMFLFTVVYGSNRSVERQLLWSELRKFHVLMGNKPWVMSGDFNALLFPHDALGGISVRNSEMVDFFECVDDIEVFDLRYTGIQHTWCQKPKDESGLRRKLDRVMGNIAFTSMFGNASVTFLPRGISDHSPSLLAFKVGIRKRRWGFKFDNYLVNHNSFLPIVSDVWRQRVDGTFMFRVTQRLKALKKPLRNLRNTYGDLRIRVNKLKEELDIVQLAADLDPFSVALREDVEILRIAYQKAKLDEEEAIRQRAKVKWLREGDSNTKFFHMVVKEKRHAQQIHAIRKVDGTFVYDDDVPIAFVENLKMLLGTRDETLVPEMPPHLFVNSLSLQDALFMIRPIEDADIRNAMFSIGNEKAPGSDGYSARFFKAAWSVLGEDVSTAIHNFFYRSTLDKELNHTLLCLLPKTPNSSSVTDFRPISCCNVLYKCISKILVNRIKPYLDGLVSRSQSAFIPGRRIVDNILMAHELVVGYHLHAGPPRCAFKIDIRKAYDMIGWRFLLTMLTDLGARGIRQGDPLSPYLFTVVMEGFTMLFKECIREATTFGYHPGCTELEITHLCFADDLFVFTSGDVGSVDILKQALHLFSAKSGLMPSLEKSEVFFGNVSPEIQNAIIESLAFKPGTFPIRYLGVPLSPISLKVSEFGGLITKVKARINNWKSKFLSFGGRKQLVISVLQSLQLYWMAVFLFPSTVIHELEALCRDFLWAQGNSSRGKCKVAWDAVCKPISCGGLGLRRLAAWNRALLSKHLWDMCANRNSLWVMWISLFYVKQDSVWKVRALPRWSWTFRKILSLREDFRPFIHVRLGDGLSTNAWEDNWLGTRLTAFISYRSIHNAGFSSKWSVAELVSATNGEWPNDWLDRYPLLDANGMPNLIAGERDAILWDNDVSDIFVKKVYTSLVGILRKSLVE
ncbi:hypothetical protein OSB04_un000818 [Centaurea solstitialis]|uniref:Reverse transcriptase domain-containing protein n=1 Tax=Centaurea solstitialis TaxID=347529 RepID=A0AA38VV54_9ASTR|nr:hypothetical protein OSB04_un000818 [Centaurea solstitialis]